MPTVKLRMPTFNSTALMSDYVFHFIDEDYFRLSVGLDVFSIDFCVRDAPCVFIMKINFCFSLFRNISQFKNLF